MSSPRIYSDYYEIFVSSQGSQGSCGSYDPFMKNNKQNNKQKSKKRLSATKHAIIDNHNSKKTSRSNFIKDSLSKQSRSKKVSARVLASRESVITTKEFKMQEKIENLFYQQLTS